VAQEIVLKGSGCSPGLAVGKAWILAPRPVTVEDRKVAPGEVAAETDRFLAAVARAREQLSSLQRSVAATLDDEHAAIFAVQSELLQDPEFMDETMRLIENERLAAETATRHTVDRLEGVFAALEGERFRQRAADVGDAGDRVLAHLVGAAPTERMPREKVVVVAVDLKPSQTVQFDRELVRAIAVDGGGRMSHSAILARSLAIPAVVGLGCITEVTRTGDALIVDGDEGLVIVNPDADTLDRYRAAAARRREGERRLEGVRDLPAVTRDGRRVEVAANIGGVDDVAAALAGGAEGIGLCRTEFIYMGAEDLPSEDEQFAAYKAIVERMGGRPTIFRTLDIGGDKDLPYLDLPAEDNPALGWRAIRISLHHTEMFKAQLRAILRAAACGPVKLMFPMISGLDELLAARELLRSAAAEVAHAGRRYDDAIEVGMMVEVPAAAVAADILAPHVDFFSIGTNDLVQYTLAAGRGNDRVASLATPFHPAVLLLIRGVADAARAADIWVGMCGEMAGRPEAIPLLVGLGLDELSVAPGAVARAKSVVRSLSRAEAEGIAERALSLPTAAAVRDHLEQSLVRVEGAETPA